MLLLFYLLLLLCSTKNNCLNAHHFDEYFRLVNYDAVNMVDPYCQVVPIKPRKTKLDIKLKPDMSLKKEEKAKFQFTLPAFVSVLAFVVGPLADA